MLEVIVIAFSFATLGIMGWLATTSAVPSGRTMILGGVLLAVAAVVQAIAILWEFAAAAMMLALVSSGSVFAIAMLGARKGSRS
jgi:hypothetical protein